MDIAITQVTKTFRGRVRTLDDVSLTATIGVARRATAVRLAFTGLVMYVRDLDAANASPNPPGRADPAETLSSLAPPTGGTASGRVRDLVEVVLPTSRCSADEVARAMGINRRTLHRHLAAGATSSSIVDSTRAGLAERYQANDRNRMTEISVLLGFAAPSAFTRWFRQRFGDSPTAWRRRRADLL
jgi:AraC-like DNA-binding protein